MTAMVFEKEITPFDIGSEFKLGRLLRLERETKASFLLELCFEEDGHLIVRRCELLKRHLSKVQVKVLLEKAWGSSLVFTIDKVLPEVLRIRWDCDRLD